MRLFFHLLYWCLEKEHNTSYQYSTSLLSIVFEELTFNKLVASACIVHLIVEGGHLSKESPTLSKTQKPHLK